MGRRISEILQALSAGEDGATVYDIFAGIFTGLDERLAVVEGVSSSLADLQIALQSSGAAIVAAALDPVLAAIETKADLGAILTASSISEVDVGSGLRTLVISPAASWPMFAPAHILSVTATDDPTIALYARRVSWDADTGTLVVDVLAAAGSGVRSSWTISPGSLAAMAAAISVAAASVEVTGPSLQAALGQIATALGARQPLADNLTDLAGLALVSDRVLATGTTGALTQIALSVYGKALLAMTSADALRSSIGAAPLASAALTGEPTAPTAPVNADSNRIANITAVRAAVAALVNSSPAALDTLAELASALGNDPAFASTVITALANKQPLDNTLTALAGLTTAADRLIYATGADAFATTALTSLARLLLAATTDSAMRTVLGLPLPISIGSGGTGAKTRASARYNLGFRANVPKQRRVTSSSWLASTTPADNNWFAICWAAELGLYCAIAQTGSGNSIMTSPDGVTWTARTSPADNSWSGLCWAAELGLFVAVGGSGTGNRVMTSPDGITWTLRTSAADNSWRSVCWAAELGLLVAVAITGSGNRVMTSPDGITWTTRASAADYSWSGVCWAAELGLLVAVASDVHSNPVMTSPDGITWTTRIATSNTWYGVCWAAELGLLIAVANSGTGNRVMTSPNGIDWTTRTSAADNGWVGVCWAAEIGLAVAVAITGTSNRVMTSPNGIDWTTRTSAADNGWRAVCWAAELGLLAAVANSGTGNRAMTSVSAHAISYRSA